MYRPNLHRVNDAADWAHIPNTEQNVWQKIAVRTNGFVTPANFITVAGALLVLAGIWQLRNEVTLLGIVLIAVGRLADIVDGMIADKTGTKSPLGEALDAVTDKILAFIFFIFLWITMYVPLFFLIILVIHSLTGSAITLYARATQKPIHPSLIGKITVALSWLAILAFLVAELLRQRSDELWHPFQVGAWYLTGVFIALAIWSLAGYIKDAKLMDRHA